MRIKADEHALDRGEHELVVVDRLDIGLLDQAHHCRKAAHVIEIDFGARLGRGCRRLWRHGILQVDGALRVRGGIGTRRRIRGEDMRAQRKDANQDQAKTEWGSHREKPQGSARIIARVRARATC